VRKVLGPFWWILHNKYYIDEIYQYTIIAFSGFLAKFLYWVDDFWVIDPIVDGIGKIALWLSHVTAEFDRLIVDGVVNGVAAISDRTGDALRNMQDGQVQVYLLVAAIFMTVWLLLQALPIILTLV